MFKTKLLALTILLSGCAYTVAPTSHVFKTTQSHPELVEVFIQRDTSPLNMVCSVNFSVDNKALVNLNPGEFSSVYITPGAHEFRVSAGTACADTIVTKEVNLTKGENKKYSINAPFYGGIYLEEMVDKK